MSLQSFYPVLLLVCTCIELVHSKDYTNKVLLVSMDGFRADYLDTVNTPNFDRFIKEGVRAKYMKPCYPSNTFPSHYTIATGLYPESNGITDNGMYDPVLDATFTKASDQPVWWDEGEPIWVTAKKQKLKVGTYFWPGSTAEIHGIRPDAWFPYSDDPPFNGRVDTVVDWFKNKGFQMATLYFPEPDSTGHQFGPGSPEVEQKVVEMDRLLGYLMDQVQEAGLEDQLNVIITSDHGMAAVDVKNRVVDISDYVDMRKVERVPSLGTMAQIQPVEGALEEILRNLTGATHITAYRKDQVPDKYHYSNNVRIMPIVIQAEEGWEITTNKTRQAQSTLKGDHGYDNDLVSMRAIFLARGPNFKKNVVVDHIPNVDVYPLMCELLSISAAPNNGSLDILSAALQESSISIGSLVRPHLLVIVFSVMVAGYNGIL